MVAEHAAPAEATALGTAAAPGSPTAAWPPGEVLRDIARGGLAGLIAGVLVGGLGGRIVMRLAALIVPSSAGAFTENGNRIGAITLEGSLALLIFVGLFVGLGAGFVWVTIRPWLPGGPGMRALLVMPVAVALGSFGLIQGENPDFEVLERSPVVLGVLVALVALIGLSVALLDAWLDRRLPRASSAASGPAGAYSIVLLLGLVFGLLVVVPGYIGQDVWGLGAALVVVGIATLATWTLRIRGRDQIPPLVAVLGYGGLAAAVIVGFAGAWSEIRFALRI
jgi:hypothetical protein